MSRRAWVVAGTVLALVAATGLAWTRLRSECGAEVTSLPASQSRTPFLDAEQRKEQPDGDRDTLVTQLQQDPAPIGEVKGAVGYHYEQFAQVSSYAQGIGIRTRSDPDFTMLDDATLRPRWSVRVGTKRSTYDASAERYLVATMPGDAAPDLVSLDADSGERVWCVPLGERRVRADDPFATQILDDEDVAVLAPGAGAKERIVRLSARDGELGWERTIDADSGDFLGDLGGQTLLMGGREQYRLFEEGDIDQRPAGTSLVALSARDGSTLWKRESPAGSDVHVLGTEPETGLAVVIDRREERRRTELRAINRDGDQKWHAVPAAGAPFDAALRNGRVVVRVGNRWLAYGLEDGRLLWRRTVPAKPQFLPYGFELDSMPLLDADHALIGGTTALQVLDLDTGEMTPLPLPTDGINTTFWPYQLAVSEKSIAIATNTAAVVVGRD